MGTQTDDHLITLVDHVRFSVAEALGVGFSMLYYAVLLVQAVVRKAAYTRAIAC